MNHSNVIDISKSSLVGLKAELFKKQEEIRKIKEQQQKQQNYIKSVSKPKKKAELQKSNEGVGKRSQKDIESVEYDYDVLKKSREVLEAKSKLYDKLNGNNIDAVAQSKYLIDFDLKHTISQQETPDTKCEESKEQTANEENYYSDDNSDPDNDWVDFVDTLGRSRRCLRIDLPKMKDSDIKLAATLRPPSPPPMPEVSPELLSWDMQREIMRKKWEEQETMLLGKKDIHYQDVRFDETRAHGVGYFEFSMDESERLKQQEALRNLRSETIEQQEAAEGLKARRKEQLQVRLAAARRRRQERLGLPPDELETPETAINTPNEEQESQTKEDKVEDLEESIKKIAPVRPWDIGKEGIKPVMTQEEWIEKKRLERPDEFAPPNTILSSHVEHNPSLKKPNDNRYIPKTSSQSKKLGVSDFTSRISSDCVSSSNLLNNWKSNVNKRNPYKLDNVGKIEETPFRTRQAFTPSSQSKTEQLSGTKKDTWKPTGEQIDNLLSKAKEHCFISSAVEDLEQNILSRSEIIKNKTCHDPALENWEKPPKKNCMISQLISNPKKYNPLTKDQIDGRFNSFTNNNSKTHQSIIQPEKEVQCSNESKNQLNFKDIEDKFSNNSCPLGMSVLKQATNHSSAGKRKWAEVAPPTSMSYYTGSKHHVHKKLSSANVADSISVGLNYLKTQSEEKDKKRIKGLLEII